jgi:hypothetical protein
MKKILRQKINQQRKDLRSALKALLPYEDKMDAFDKIGYSPMERKILAVIPEWPTMINTLDLVEIVYEPGKEPRNARQSILTAVNSLIEKSDENMEPFEIFKSKPRGSQPSYFWRKERE